MIQAGVSSATGGSLRYDPGHGTFIQTVTRGGKYGRSVAIATSRDFKSWTDLGVVFRADELNQKLGGETIRGRLTGEFRIMHGGKEPGAAGSGTRRTRSG